MQLLMTSRQWLVTGALLVLVLGAIVGSILTRDSGSPVASSTRNAPGQAPLVDERPLQTARAMLPQASGPDEQRVAEEAERLADNEVDLAFHDAARDAADHPPMAKSENKELFEHLNQAEKQVKADQDQLDQLKTRVAAGTGGTQDSLQQQVAVVQAQLELDQDELNDAKEELVQSGADPGSSIQRQFEQHQAAEHANDEKPQASKTPEAKYGEGSFLAQFSTWRALRSKAIRVQQARDEAGQVGVRLRAAHDALAKQIGSEKSSRQTASPPPEQSNVGQSGNGEQSKEGANSTIKSLHLLSDDKKNLADLDKRLQDAKELVNTYGNWIVLVENHQRAALHGMIGSGLWILLILLAVYLAGRVVDRYLAGVGAERTRLHTLRAVIRFAAQAVGVLLILFVVFGAPRQMPTILGLAGAGLTVALKDFIVGFFGWFVLMGKNGIRVGDWVEINGVAGEVVEINLLRTVLLETGNWTDTGHPTGRKVAFVNSFAIEGHFFNFSTSGQWLWDEIEIIVPPEQDPYPIIDEIQQIVTKETEASARAAESEWKSTTTRYRVRAVSATPAVNLRPTALGVEVHIRYITGAHERFATRARLYQKLVDLLHHKNAGMRRVEVQPAGDRA